MTAKTESGAWAVGAPMSSPRKAAEARYAYENHNKELSMEDILLKTNEGLRILHEFYFNDEVRKDGLKTFLTSYERNIDEK